MALWGTADSLYSLGTVTVDYAAKTITGSGTSFTAAGITEGTVISIGAGSTFGSAVISGITSDSLISIATTQYLSGAPISGVGYTLSRRPIYTLEDSNYNNGGAGAGATISSVYGVDIYETGAVATTQYAVTHAGWVGIKTYIGSEGELRVKSETLVAMSEISSGTGATFGAAGDAVDDAIFPDAIITITSQPTSVGVGTTVTATFSVTASATPSYAPLSYQWQEDDGGGFDNLVGETGTSVSIANTDTSKNGYEYQVVVSSGDVSVTSGIATMTVS
jgi:hypothetical protein